MVSSTCLVLVVLLRLTGGFHSMDSRIAILGAQLPYNQSPLEYFQQLFSERFPEKDVQVHFLARILHFALTLSQAWRAQLGRFGLSGSHQTSPIRHLSDGLRNR